MTNKKNPIVTNKQIIKENFEIVLRFFLPKVFKLCGFSVFISWHIFDIMFEVIMSAYIKYIDEQKLLVKRKNNKYSKIKLADDIKEKVNNKQTLVEALKEAQKIRNAKT